MPYNDISKSSNYDSSVISYERRIYTWIVFIGTIIVYSLTCCRTVYVGDSGELTLAMSTGGIAHPPGYPLYTILGYIWLKLFAFLRPALAANLFSAAMASVAATILFRLLEIVNKGHLPSIANAALVFVFAFSYSVWSSSTSAEVYALSALLYITSLYFVLGYHLRGGNSKFIIAAFSCGLILTHHFSSIVIVAGLITVIIIKKKFSLRLLALALIAFALPLTLYFYLLLRFDPNLPVNWMSEKSLLALWQLFSGENYQQFLAIPTFGDFLLFIRKLNFRWLIDFGPAIALLAIPGLIYGFRRNAKLTFILILPALLNLLMVSCYQIPDYDGYLMPTIITIIILISFALASWWKFISQKGWLSVLIIICLIVLPMATNYGRCDISDFYLAERYGRDLLDSTPDDSILLLKSDNGSHTALYLHYLENHRPDIELYSSYSTLTRFLQKYTMDDFINFGMFGPADRRVCRGIEYLINPEVSLAEPMGSQQGFVKGNLYSYPDDTGHMTFMSAFKDTTIDLRIADFAQDSIPLIELPDDYKAGQIALEYLLFLMDPYRKTQNISDYQPAWDELKRVGKKTHDPQTALIVARYCKFHIIFNPSSWLELAGSFDPPSYIRKDILVNWASYYRGIGDLSTASQALRDALAIDPDFNTALYNLRLLEAQIATGEGDWDAAIHAYEILFQLDDQNPMPLYNIAVLLERIPGKAADAIEYYEKFLEAAEIARTRRVAESKSTAKQRIEILQTTLDPDNNQPPYNRKLK